MSDIEDKKESFISILQAVTIAHKLWRNITENMVANCFRTCGFPIQTGKNHENQSLLKITTLEQNGMKLLPTIMLNFYISRVCGFYDQVTGTSSLTDSDIVDSVSQASDDKDHKRGSFLLQNHQCHLSSVIRQKNPTILETMYSLL